MAYQHMSPANAHPARIPPEPISSHLPPNGQPPPTQGKPTIQEYFTGMVRDTWLQLGTTSEKLGMNVEAIDSYHNVLRHDRLNVPALRGCASILRSEDKYDQAVEYIRSILQATPKDGDSWSSLGHCYLMMDELQQAYSAYQSALYNLRDPKEPKLWYGIGILYDRYGSLDHAEEAFSQVMRMAPNFDKANEIYFRLGIIYKQQQKYDESLQCFKYIVSTPPTPLNQTDIWFQIGHVYEQQKKYDEAKSAYTEVLARDRKHAKVLQQLGWLHHQQSNDYQSQEHAIEYLEQSVSSDQTDAQSWYLLGRCYMSQHKYPKAYEAYQQAVYRDGRNPTFWCSIGVLYYQINQYRDALDAYSRAIRLNPNISEVWYDLGTLYESCNNQTADALDAYHRAAELDPTNTAIKARLDLLRNGQGANQPNGTAAPMPRDVPPQAYQPAGAGQLQQTQPWAPPAHPPQHQPAPPPLIGRDWSRQPETNGAPQPSAQHQQYQQPPPPLGPPGGPSQTLPPANFDQRDPARYQPQLPPHQRQPSPGYQNHDPYRNERRLSPSPRSRHPGDASRAHATLQAPHQQGPNHHQPTPTRITNPNYGGQHVAPLTPSSATASQPQSTYTRPASPQRPPPEGRPRSPPPYYLNQPSYNMPAEPSGPSNIASGAPPPLSASTAAEAASRDRDRENGVHNKRLREWDSREDLHAHAHKRNGTDESRARLEDQYPRRTHSPAWQQERDRAAIGGPPSRHASPPRIPRPEDIRRADEEYKPSAIAHQPAPLNTVMHQIIDCEPSREPPRQSLPPISAVAPSAPPPFVNGADVAPPKQEEPEPQRMEVDEELKAPEPLAAKKPEEPAARKVEVDENYDDDSADEAKQPAAPPSAEPASEPVAASAPAPDSGYASRLTTQDGEPVSTAEASGPNGVPAAPEPAVEPTPN